MGIVNVTPDSFYKGSRFTTDAELLQQVEKMVTDGVFIVDVGGCSTRPGAEEVPVSVERDRVMAAIKIIKKEFPELLISVDTYRSAIAHMAVHEGAAMVNDVSGGNLDTKMFETVAALKVPYVLMHMRGTPQTMGSQTSYEDLTLEIIADLQSKLSKLHAVGFYDVIIDPGFGFAKTIAQNFELLKNLEALRVLGKPILTGLSRKSMVWRTLNISAQEALNGTTALHSVALLKGANILRVHDVYEAAQTIKLISQIC